MKKKERPAIFPNHNTDNPLPTPPVKPYKLQVGTTFRVGNPANQSYLFLSDSLKPKVSPFKVDVPVADLVDQIVTVKGILQLSNDTRTVILERKDNGSFFKGQNRIYADVHNAVVAKELIAL